MKYIVFILAALLYTLPVNYSHAQTQAVPFGHGFLGFKKVLPFAAVGGGAYLGYKALHNTQVAGQDIDMAAHYAVASYGTANQSISLDQLRNTILAHPLVGKNKASQALGKEYSANPTAVAQIAAMLGIQVKQPSPNTIGSKVAEDILILERRGWMLESVKKLVLPIGVTSLTPKNTQPKLEVHHVISYEDPDASVARTILTKWKLSIHDPANAVIIPSDCHRGQFVHGQLNKQYEKSIVVRFENVDQNLSILNFNAGRENILQTLRDEGDKISNACNALGSRAWILQNRLRTIEKNLPRPMVNNFLDAAKVVL